MSSTSTPISAHQFASAIKDLPLGNLYAKAVELRNSITHLESSNQQLEIFAEDDQLCADAIKENEDVIKNMAERISLLKSEVEKRGFRLDEYEQEVGLERTNGYMENDEVHDDEYQQRNSVTSDADRVVRIPSNVDSTRFSRELSTEAQNDQEEGVDL